MALRLVVVVDRTAGSAGDFGTTDPVVIEVAAAAGAAEKSACSETMDQVAFVVVLVAEMGSKRL